MLQILQTSLVYNSYYLNFIYVHVFLSSCKNLNLASMVSFIILSLSLSYGSLTIVEGRSRAIFLHICHYMQISLQWTLLYWKQLSDFKGDAQYHHYDTQSNYLNIQRTSFFSKSRERLFVEKRKERCSIVHLKSNSIHVSWL